MKPCPTPYCLWSNWKRALRRASCVLAVAGGCTSAPAFPPAPYYTVFGDVRDQYGVLIPPQGAAVVLSSGGREVLRESLVDGTDRGYNYQVRLRMDLQRTGTQPYSSLALGIGTTYTLSVVIDGLTYLPIEMSTPPQTGNPGNRIRINLTLGVDSDNDGLPDAWEEAQLFHAGVTPGPDGWDLSLIDASGDFDGDGRTNIQEYRTGTYATDKDSHLELSVVDVLPTAVRLRFYAFYGRVYVLQTSTNMTNWTPVAFTTTNPEEDTTAAEVSYLQATNTGVVEVYVPKAQQGTYYRLSVR